MIQELDPELDPELDSELDPELDPELDLELDPGFYPGFDPGCFWAPLGTTGHLWAPLGTAEHCRAPLWVLGAAGHICANFATCSWEPLTMLNPQFVAGEHGLFGGHKSEDTHSYCSEFGKNLPDRISENSRACRTGPT